jgi:hypothetical protein
MMLQIVPSNYWAEPMHLTGLFWDMLRTVTEDKVRFSFLIILLELNLSLILTGVCIIDH